MSRRLLPAVVLPIAWRSVQLAQQRLESHSPEVFARVRTPAS